MIINKVALAPNFLIGNKEESILPFDLFDETMMQRTIWFRKQMKATFHAGFE
jgi:hypothetical protein